MTEREREARRLRVLQARLRQDWNEAKGVYQRLSVAVERVRRDGPDEVTVGAAALYLENFYTAIEELLRRIAAEVDGSVPVGDDGQRELLEQLKVALPETRPAVLGDELFRSLDLLRRFRHLVRHAYAVDYDWDQMQAVLAAGANVFALFPGTLAELDGWLGRTIAALEGRGE